MITRKEQAAQAKGRLMQAAKDLIIRKGYDNVTIADITNACGMSAGNFYNYFKTKGDLIVVLEREPYARSMEEILQRNNGVLDMLASYMRKWNELSENNYGKDFTRQWFVYHVNHPTEVSDPQNKVNLAISELSRCLNKGVERGELKAETPVEMIARGIAFSIIGSEFHFVTTEARFDKDRWTEEYCEKILPLLLSPYFVEQKSY